LRNRKQIKESRKRKVTESSEQENRKERLYRIRI
jgi:hypothetical protein